MPNKRETLTAKKSLLDMTVLHHKNDIETEALFRHLTDL